MEARIDQASAEKMFLCKRGVLSHLPVTLESILRQKKEELWKLKYFTMQKHNLQKNPLKRNQNKSFKIL
jgi:hypothetical protein